VTRCRYVVRPKADEDLDEQAYHYAVVASSTVGHRFLIAAHDTFALLTTQPNMGWHSRLRHPQINRLRVFRVKGFEKILILYLPPLLDGVDVLRVVHGSRNLQALLRREGLE
jgi:plasmid stabilization system protein ParE